MQVGLSNVLARRGATPAARIAGDPMIVHMKFKTVGKIRRVAGELYWRSRLKGKDKLKV